MNHAHAEIDMTTINGCPEITGQPDLEAMRENLTLELEHLRCLHQSSFVGREPDSGDPLFPVLYRKFRETCRKLMINLPKQEAPLYAQKAVSLFNRNRTDEALEHLECALRIQPGDGPALADLKRVRGREEAAALIDSRKIDYLGSFGEGFVSKPSSLAAREGRDILVCEPSKNAVHSFDLEFRHQGRLDIDLNRPINIFKDENETAWVCDYGNGRIVSVGNDSELNKEFVPADFAPRGFEHVRPGCACTHDGWFHILATNDDPHDLKIISFHRDDPADSFKVLNSSGLFRPFSIAWQGGRLVVGTFVPSALYQYDPEADRFRNFQIPIIPGELRGLVASGRDLLAACTDYVCKISSRGRLEMVGEMSRLTGRQGSVAPAICIHKQDKKSELLIADKRLNCIHRFSYGNH